ncbi:MAG: NTP transferase domain-containing protein [Candidatus Babeliaceae bacterium]|nr:NTP transferase domain-containing protein [Candidatus Babeliaceae bacterium]
MEKVYGVVLAGGSGKRLWPLSRQGFPKQLIPLGQSSLLVQALTRLQEIPFITDAAVVTTQEYAPSIKEKLDNDILIITEPESKNTAAAILISCLEIAKHDIHATVIFAPADHVVVNKQAFSAAICAALAYVSDNDQLALIGVTPTHASTAYGYIERGHDAFLRATDLYNIVSFHEKPSRHVAHTYLSMSTMLWNCGIFCARVQTYIELFMRHMPELYAQVKEGRYSDITPVSFDKGVVEKVHNAVVVHGKFSWTDVGTLEQFIDEAQKSAACSNEPCGKMVSLESHNVRAYARDKLVVLFGVENICVVETDDTIVVMNTEYSNNMDKIVEHLYKKGYERYL